MHFMDLISCMYAWVMWDVLSDTWVIWWHVLALLADTSNSKERGELATETAVWSWIAEIGFKFPASCSHASRTHGAHAQAYDHSEYMHHCWFGISQVGITGKKEKNSASALCQITPSEQGIPQLSAPSTSGRCLFWECPAPCVTLLTNMIGNQEADDAIYLWRFHLH